MSNIKAVVFDLYGTLIHLTDETKPYARLFVDLGLQTPKKFGQSLRIALTEDFEDLASLVRRIKPDTQINLEPYQQELEDEQASISLYPKTREVLTKLKEQKIKLGLISNLASPYKKPFFDLKLNEYFDEILFSCEIGLIKPNKKIYQKMIERFTINPNQVLMIGDKVPADVYGPKSIGMNAVHLDRTNNSTNSISSLEEVFQYL